ncbi:hypothetical protein C0J52_15703 [Blattella germanica]|nr:hypothetical protein C0J52_15703 [Blattella germanica]
MFPEESSTMDKANAKKDSEKLSISQYFAQSSSSGTGASFFDQISGNGPAMMMSVKESASSQDLFQAASAPLMSTGTSATTPTTATVTSTVITEGSIQKPSTMGTIPEIPTSSQTTSDLGSKLQEKVLNSDAKTPVKEEPVVCRIFSSQEVPPDNISMASGKTFFDMLGTGQQNARSPLSITSPSGAPGLLGVDLMIPGLPTSSSASSMMTSPDFTTTTDGSFLTPSSPTTPTPTAATSPPGTFFPERELLTMPGVDTVHEVVNHYLGEAEAAKRKVLTVNDVTQDERGLRELIQILRNLDNGLCEDGSPAELSASDRAESKKLWSSREARVLHAIVNSALYQKDYSLAVEVLELLLNGREWGNHHKRALQSALGRVYLQLGDVTAAEKNFALARDLRQQQSWNGSTRIDRPRFNGCSTERFPGGLLNNMGVCLLYLGRLKEALSLLEGAVNNNPIQGLHESLLLNVCTLYELESSHSNQKKLGMLRLLSRYKGDGVCVACLKLQM